MQFTPKNRDDWRDWLRRNHADESEVWLQTTDDARACVVVREIGAVSAAEVDEERGFIVLKLKDALDLAELSHHLHSRDLRIRYLERQDPTLEQVFMTLTKGLVQ